MVFEGFNNLLLLPAKVASELAALAQTSGAHCTIWAFKYGILHGWWRFVKESEAHKFSFLPRIQGRLNLSVAQRQTALRVYTAARFCYIQKSIEQAAVFPAVLSCRNVTTTNTWRHTTTGSDGRRHDGVWGAAARFSVGLLDLEHWCCIILRTLQELHT